MRIAVVNITAGNISGGYKRYLMKILPRMADCPEIKSILCTAPFSLNLSKWFTNPGKIEFVGTRPSGFSYFNWHFELKRCLERFSPDVIFVPVERYLRFRKVPVVNMVQNMEPFVKTVKGNSLVERVKNKLKYFEGKKAVKASSVTIALTEFVKHYLTSSWGIPDKKISLIHHGIDAAPEEEGDRPQTIPKRLAGKFLFTAGSLRPARGLEDLLLAMGKMTSQDAEKFKLVIAGNGGTAGAYKTKLRRLAGQMNLSSNIIWTGLLNEREMTWCYQNCRVFFMTSRVESFGMIAAEAMAHGCISIAADNPSLPEIFRDTAVYYPARNAGGLVKALNSVLGWDDSFRAKISQNAKKRASEFSWAECAQKTISVLIKAGSG